MSMTSLVTLNPLPQISVEKIENKFLEYIYFLVLFPQCTRRTYVTNPTCGYIHRRMSRGNIMIH